MLNSRILSNRSGFTLLEVMIAVTLMLIAWTSIFATQSSSQTVVWKSTKLNDVTMLARSKMSEIETEIEGKRFEEVKKEESGTFPDPWKEYSWKKEIKEVEFPNISMQGGGGSGESGSGDAKDSGGSSAEDSASGNNTDAIERMMRLITKFLSQSIREVRLTLNWKQGASDASFTLTTWWVDLNHEFSLSE
jgi:general secretion pathway protein I